MNINGLDITVERQGDYFLASSEGELRPILAEGRTAEEAREQHNKVYGEQYAQAAELEHRSIQWFGE